MAQRFNVLLSKRQIRLVAIILLFVLVLYGWHALFRLPLVPISSWEAVPKRAAVVLEIEQPQDWLAQLQQESVEKLITIPPGQYLQHNLQQLQNLFGAETILEKPILAVLQQGSPDKLAWLYISRTSLDIEDWLAHQNSINAQTTFYRDITIYTLNLPENKTLALSSFRNLLLVGERTLLIETAIDELKDVRKSLTKDGRLNKLRRSAESADLYINLENLPLFLAPYANTAKRPLMDKLNALTKWVRLNIQVDSTVWKLEGDFAPVNTSFWKTFRSQNEVEQRAIQQVLPKNLAIAAVFSLSEAQLRQAAGEPWINGYFLPWLDGQLAVGTLESSANSLENQQFVVAKVTDAVVAEQKLQAFAEEAGELSTEPYQLFELRQIMAHQPFAALLGEDVAGLHNPWYVLLDEYAIFCNSKSALEAWIDRYLVGETLINDVEVQTTFSTLEPEGKVTVYGNLQRLLPLWQQVFKASDATFLDYQLQQLNRVRQFTLQFGAKGLIGGATSLTINNQQSTILKRIPLQAEALTPPQVVQRSSNGPLDVLIQDEQYRLYCFDQNGNLRWEVALEEPILSKIQTVDFYRNGQFQYIFNTANRIYGFDNSGKSLGAFPIELQSPATNGVTVVDFTQSNTYSYFVACANGNVYGYGQMGEPLPGWKPKEAIGQVTQSVLHFQRESNDYLVVLDDVQQVHVFQRNGAERFASDTLEAKVISQIDFQADGAYPRIVAPQRQGKVLVMALNGESFHLSLTGNFPMQDFAYADVWGDGRKDYISLSGNKLSVAAYEGTDFKTRWTYTFPTAPNEIFQVTPTNSAKNRIGALLNAKQQIFIFDENGKLRRGFPLAGTTPFQIADFFGSGEETLVVANGADLYYYRLPVEF